MKRIILSALLIPLAVNAGFNKVRSSTTNLVEVRSGDWPMNIEKYTEPSNTSFALIFRDQQVTSGVMLDTLDFPNLVQLKYLEKALTVLKTGHNGDIAKFNNYSITRTDKNYDGVWYLLRIKWGLTNFRQTEADLMIKYNLHFFVLLCRYFSS
jgi:hypothetical protein